MNCSLPGSSVHGILQAKIPEWVAIPFSIGSSQHRDQASVSCRQSAGRFFTIWATGEGNLGLISCTDPNPHGCCVSPSRGFWSCQVSGLQDSWLKPVSFCFPSAGQDPPCACVCVRVLCVCAMCVCYVCVCYVRMCYVCVCYVCVMCACVKCACVMCACACRGSHHPCHF